MTRVISVRGKDKATLLSDPSFVYVGRRCAGWPASIWGNPYRAGKPSGRRGYGGTSDIHPPSPYFVPTAEEAVARFRRQLEFAVDVVRQAQQLPVVPSDFERMAVELPKLRGKTLACWCGCWQPGEPEINCHAVVLAQFADQTCCVH